MYVYPLYHQPHFLFNGFFGLIVWCSGSYGEMYTFVSASTALLPKRPSNPNAAFIVSAFKTAGNLDSLDRSWTYWSGADYVVEHIPRSPAVQFQFRFISLIHRVAVTWFRSVSMSAGFRRNLVGKTLINVFLP